MNAGVKVLKAQPNVFKDKLGVRVAFWSRKWSPLQGTADSLDGF